MNLSCTCGSCRCQRPLSMTCVCVCVCVCVCLCGDRFQQIGLLQPGMVANLARGKLNEECEISMCPRLRLGIRSRETGSAVSRPASNYPFPTTRMKLMLSQRLISLLLHSAAVSRQCHQPPSGLSRGCQATTHLIQEHLLDLVACSYISAAHLGLLSRLVISHS